jgi:hypothetical protein
MKFEFKRAKNGLVMEITNWEGEIEKIVYAEGDSDEQEIERFVEFLQTIDHHYGPSTGRYSKERISISTVVGDKYEDINHDT